MSDLTTGVIAPLLAAVAVLSAPVAIVFMVLHHRRVVTAMKLKAATDFTERGAAVPFDLLLGPRTRPGDGDLRIGMVLTCFGIGTLLFAFTLKEHRLWGLGLLPLFAGIGYLITWKLSHRPGTAGQDG